jgi:hypothetical protein
MAAPSGGAPQPRITTEPALGCLLGFASWQCQNDFFAMPARRGVRALAPEGRGIAYCADKRSPSWTGCPDGALEAVDYLGTNAAGDDVYKVQYMNAETTYVLAQPNQAGKVEHFWIKRGDPNGIVPSYRVDVPAQNAHQIAIYPGPER